MKRSDRVRVTTFVAVAPLDAFEVFTREIDLWWKRGPAFRMQGEPSVMRFEGEAAGRLIEASADGSSSRELGKVLAWEPGVRLMFEWRGYNFAAHERTEVEVHFEAMNDGTQVTLEHRGFAALPDDHPVRHGADDAAFIRRLGMWWGEMISSYRLRT